MSTDLNGAASIVDESMPRLPPNVRMVGKLSLGVGIGSLLAGLLLLWGGNFGVRLFSVTMLAFGGLLIPSAVGLLLGYSWGRGGTIMCYLGPTVTLAQFMVIQCVEGMGPWGFPLWEAYGMGGTLLALIAIDVFVFKTLLGRPGRLAFQAIRQWRSSRKHALPVGVQILGWFFVLAAAADLVLFPVLLVLIPQSLTGPRLNTLGAKVFLTLMGILLVAFVVFGITLLRRLDWGRRGLMGSVFASFFLGLGMMIHQRLFPEVWSSPVGDIETSLGEAVMQVVLLGVVVGTVLLYLHQSKVRVCFRAVRDEISAGLSN